MSVNVTGEGPCGPGGGGVFGRSPPPYDRPVRGVGVGVCATALTEDAMRATKSNERQRLFSLRNLCVLCVSVMRSVPGAVATGLCSDRFDHGWDRDPVAAAPGTDLIAQRAPSLRRVLLPTDSEGDDRAPDFLNFLCFIDQLIIPLVRNAAVIVGVRRITMTLIDRIRFGPQMGEHVMPAS